MDVSYLLSVKGNDALCWLGVGNSTCRCGRRRKGGLSTLLVYAWLHA